MKKNIFERFYDSACRGWELTKDLLAFQLMIYIVLGLAGVIVGGLSYLFS